MPNYVTNVIKYDGDPEQIRKMLEFIKDDKHGLGTIDFNKLIPRPSSLDIEAGSRTDHGLRAYNQFVEVYTLGGTLDKDLLHIPEESEAVFLRMRKDIKPDEWELGKKAFQNCERFGAPTWYEWCVENWGTKWGACGYSEGQDYSHAGELRFDTAWSAPHPVIEKLASLYPDITFTHEWADEDIGNNLGRREYENGELTSEYIPFFHKESIEFACQVMEKEPSDWGLKLTEDGSDYIYMDDEEMEAPEMGGPSL